MVNNFKSNDSFHVEGRGKVFTFHNRERYPITPSIEERWFKEGIIINETHYPCKGVEKFCIPFSEDRPYTLSFGICVGEENETS